MRGDDEFGRAVGVGATTAVAGTGSLCARTCTSHSNGSVGSSGSTPIHE